MRTFSLFFFYLFFSIVNCDVFFHSPRGTNNRLNEANTNRNNANRLFDSRNNGKGGYCYGPQMRYYEGSRLLIQWTADQGCSNPRVHCTFILQYTCTDNTTVPLTEQVVDGSTTNTITFDVTGPSALDGNGNRLYGSHENLQYYQNCVMRERNKGLFVADVKLASDTATFTRQNPGGVRYGFECPEEKDYYPYWSPTPWRDIAILTDDTSFCSFYKQESENVKGRGICVDSNGNNKVANNQVACEVGGDTWSLRPSHGISAPYCGPTSFTASHFHQLSEYEWTLPKANELPCISTDSCQCVLRLRYNISSGDILDSKGYVPTGNFADSTLNDPYSPITSNPTVTVSGATYKIPLNTDQNGRTFQDRSYVFRVRPRGNNVAASATIFNLNVRGKRGNLVQTFPALQYDFVPSEATIKPGDYIHFQWTGCDTNPAGNAGRGIGQTDRNNIVQLVSLDDNYPASDAWLSDPKNPVLFTDSVLRRTLGNLNQSNCLSPAQVANLTNPDNDPQNCQVLNAASPYFDGGLVQFNQQATYYYMSTRNNNFANRDHKGKITVSISANN